MLENLFSYDYHPIVVHIPVAFLMIYSILEIVTSSFFSKKWFSFFWTKVFLLLVGALGAQGALFTGEMAEDLNKDILSRKILHAHEEWASFTAGFFWVIFVIYFILIITQKPFFKEKIDRLVDRYNFTNIFFGILRTIGEFILKYKIIFVLLGIVGLVSISVTGALGGSLVYGKDADPFVIIVLKMLNLY